MAKDPSRTEQATPKRLNKTRSEGSVANSQEFNKAVSILAGFIILSLWISTIGKTLQALMMEFLQVPKSFEISINSIYVLFFTIAGYLAKMLLPVLLFIACCLIITIRLQVGQLWTTKVFKPKWSKFNPINGLKRMLFSSQTFIRLGKSILQAFAIGIAPFFVLKSQLPAMMHLFDFSAQNIAIFILERGSQLTKYALYPLCTIAIIDLVYTRWKYKEDIKMTKDEVKDEFKQSEGDPEIKSRIRQKMRSLIGKKMLSEVPKADLIITNPTHLAIALRYDSNEAPAPVVVAKGANLIAEKIKTIAKENRIPIKENVPLARALYKQAEVGDMIPAELYQAVALMLAEIWKNRPKRR